MTIKYKIIVEKGKDGYFVAVCVTLPGCISQGKSVREALCNTSDATKGYLESLKKHNESVLM